MVLRIGNWHNQIYIFSKIFLVTAWKMYGGWKQGMTKKGGGERDLLWISLSKRETLLVWTRMVAVKMYLKNIQEVGFDFEQNLMGADGARNRS